MLKLDQVSSLVSARLARFSPALRPELDRPNAKQLDQVYFSGLLQNLQSDRI